jgi:hypothetical protein
MKKLAILMLAVALAACAKQGGDFEGKWVGTDNGQTLMAIERNGDQFLVRLSDVRTPKDPAAPIPAELKDGKLLLDRMGATVTYAKSSNTAVLNTPMGNVEFKHAK